MEDMDILNQNTSYEIYAKRRREIIRHNYGFRTALLSMEQY
jgi:hypothetical protein